jgi:hypothetical protein
MLLEFVAMMNRHCRMICTALASILFSSQLACAMEEEFVGPFPSWADVKKDFGAVGDGTVDDTAAFQAALEAMREHRKFCVLYVPSGTYRLTRTLSTLRKGHTDNMVTVVGEDPARTVLRWDGPVDGTMIQWDAWYAKFSRLTLDGAGRAGVCLQYGPSFSTYNETSDVVFRGAKNGMGFGTPESAGQAENAVLRCQFLNCEVGIQTVNWNSMDIWVWHCRFEDCGRGIHNVMGNWHAWNNLFLRSKIADVSISNLMAFSVVNNTSIGSRCFMDFSSGHTWGSPTSVTGNRILDPTGPYAMILDNAGPYLVVDNSFRLPPTSRAIRMTWADQTLVGNRYSRDDVVEERGRFRRIDEQVVAASDLPDQLPQLPAPPPRVDRPVFSAPVGASAAVIQDLLDKAAALTGQRPVVHLPMGAYDIDSTLIIRRDADVQLVGDGASEIATRLVWKGPESGRLLVIQTPSRACVRDLHIQAGAAQALVLEVNDQPGARVFADQLNVNGPSDPQPRRTAALSISGLSDTAVQLRALQGSGNAGVWVSVVGSGTTSPQPVVVMTGATGSAAGQYEVDGGARLLVRGVYHERSSDSLCGLHLTGSGELSIDATRFSYATSRDAATVAADDFRGLFTLATCILLPVGTDETCRFELRGAGAGASVLALNCQFWVNKPGTTAETVWQNVAQPPAAGGLIGCNINTSNKDVSAKGFEFLKNLGENSDMAKSPRGSGALEDRGSVTDQQLVRHLQLLREFTPSVDADGSPSTTDVQLHRVVASSRMGNTVEIRAAQ